MLDTCSTIFLGCKKRLANKKVEFLVIEKNMTKIFIYELVQAANSIINLFLDHPVKAQHNKNAMLLKNII